MLCKGITPETSAKIKNLGFVFALFVVAGHIAWVAEGLFGQAMIIAWIACFARVSVPFYFVVSGFFLAAHFDDAGWWSSAIRKRMRTLLVPYIFWLTLFAVVALVLTGRWVAGFGGYGFNLFGLPMVGALWFVRCLMIFVLISPLLKWCVQRWGAGWLVAVYLANVVVSVLTGSGVLDYESGLGGFLGYGVSVEGLVYFSLGMYLREHPLPLNSRRGPVLALLVGVMLIVMRIVLERMRIPLHIHPSVLISPFLLLGCWYFAPSARWPQWLTACGFPIYLAHGIVLAVLGQYGLSRGFVWQWVALVSGIVVPIIVFHVLRKAVPAVCDMAFGGR